YDTYSSSKACAELATAAYRRSFLQPAGVHVATARAGNVIGGGDWAEGRLIPDFFRAIDKGERLLVRCPTAIRPWQHVLDPLRGYLLLAEALFSRGDQVSEAWNFGPMDENAHTVEWILNYLCSKVPGSSWQFEKDDAYHEARYLKLDSSKAAAILGW